MTTTTHNQNAAREAGQYRQPKFAWSARCDCRNNHASSSGRCNSRNVTDITRLDSDNFAACEMCQDHCPRGKGNVKVTIEERNIIRSEGGYSLEFNTAEGSYYIHGSSLCEQYFTLGSAVERFNELLLGAPIDLQDVAMAILGMKPLPQRCRNFPACSLEMNHEGECRKHAKPFGVVVVATPDTVYNPAAVPGNHFTK